MWSAQIAGEQADVLEWGAWNGKLEKEEQLNCQCQEATVECAFVACWYL